ncbi:hypothetical protein BASA81_014168 [Batrachochytrium salamandrivorans]|nr:hypothetical protein BASA81_014168 [Batrachochytrium salamandrivorans]
MENDIDNAWKATGYTPDELRELGLNGEGINRLTSTDWNAEFETENEKELPAVAALQRAVQESPSNTDALMSLAVSYTNERQDLQAYATLDRWLTTKYPEIAKNTPHLPEQQPYVVYPTTEFHSRILSMFLAAASEGPTEATGL